MVLGLDGIETLDGLDEVGIFSAAALRDISAITAPHATSTVFRLGGCPTLAWHCLRMILLGDRCAPVTSSIGFLRAPLSDVAGALWQWRSEIHGSATTTQFTGGLAENLEWLEPLTAGVRAPRAVG